MRRFPTLRKMGHMGLRRGSALILLICVAALIRADGEKREMYWPRPELAPITAAARNTRPIQARLTGGFGYAPWNPDAPPLPEAQARVLGAAFNLFSAGKAATNPALQAALGTTFLLTGRTDDAVVQLQRAVTEPSPQPAWLSDLAAAYLTRGDRDRRVSDYVAAVAMAQRALTRAPAMAEAYFNRALALQRLGIPPAGEAWAEYLEHDPDSGFAAEATGNRAALSRAPAPASASASSNLDAVEFAPYFAWASTPAAAPPAALPAVLVARSSDRLHQQVEADLTRASGDPGTRSALRAGLLALRDAYASAERDAMSEALAQFARAAQLLEPHSRALTSVARFRLGVAEYYAGSHQRALAQLKELERIARDHGFLVVRARSLRVIGLIHATAGRFDQALSVYQTAQECARQAGAWAQVVSLHHLIAEVFNYLGETEAGWDSRGRALKALADVADPAQRQSILGSAALAALDDGYPESAAFLYRGVEVEARTSGKPIDRTESEILHARVARALGDEAGAIASVRRARDTVARIDDPAMRSRVEAELALLATDGSRASELDAALAYFSGIDALARLSDVFLVRAAAEGSRDRAVERRELEQAIAIFDRRAASLSDAERRLAHDQTGRGLYEALIESALKRGDAPAGLAALMRYHNRFAARAADGASESPVDALPAHTVALTYAALRDRLVIWILEPGRQVRLAQVPIGRERLGALVDAFVDAIVANDRSAAMAVGNELFELLLRPLTGLSADRLWIVPDGPLHRLPFAALPESPAGGFAVERWTLTLRTSLAASAPPGQEPLPAGSLIVGNPAATGVAPLPDAEREALEIAEGYPRPVLLTGPGVTARQVVAALKIAPVFHFGGHASVNRARPLLSRLRLAPAADGNPEDLFVYDLSRMSLAHVRLAVLAACRTADARSGPADGLVSLSRALLGRGVGAVVASLFDLGDRPARQLFVRFHAGYRESRQAADSLRVAQVEQLRRGPGVPLRDWAGVVVIQQ